MKCFLKQPVKKASLLLLLSFICILQSFSQSASGTYFEYGIAAGPMVFLGDLGGHFGKGSAFLKDYNMNETKVSLGVYTEMHPSELVSFRLGLNYGQVSGNDADIKGKGSYETAREDRNLDFRSNILEGMVAATLYPTVLLEDNIRSLTGRLRPYGLIGIGVFHFNPQGTYTDPITGQTTWVDLRPLHTEGEGFAEYPGRKEYALTQFNIPMGGGLKYYFNENVTLSFEFIYRKTFTDYIDDVSTTYIDPTLFPKYLSASQAAIAEVVYNKSPLRGIDNVNYGPGGKRGDSSKDDAYFTAGFKLGISFGEHDGWRNSTHCPLIRF